MHILNTLPQRLDSGATPTFTGLLAPSLTAPTDLTLAGGSTGASLVLGQGANASNQLRTTGTGRVTMQGRQGTTIAQGNESILFSAQNQGPGNLQLALGMNETGGFFPWFQSYRVGGSSGSYLVLQPAAGNVLIGTTTDISGTGGLKVAGTSTASSTTSGALQVGSNVGLSGNAGGASYFGGDITVPNLTATNGLNCFAFGIANDNAALLLKNTAGVTKAQLTTNSGSTYFDYLGSLFVRAGYGGTTALTLASTGAATFAGAVSAATSLTAQTAIITGNNSSASYPLTVKNNALKASASQYTGILIQTADASAVDLGLLYFTAASATDRTWRLGAFDNADSSWSKGLFPGAISIGSTSPSSGVGTGALQVAGGIYAGQASVFGAKITSVPTTATGYNQLYDTSGITTGRGAFAINSTGAGLSFGIESSVGGTSLTGSAAYSSYFGTSNATPVYLITNGVIRQTIDASTGAATFAGAVTVPSLFMSTDSQGSVLSSSSNVLNIDAAAGDIRVRPKAGSAFIIGNSAGLRLGNAYVAGAVVGTGYVTIQDSTGTTYKVPVLL